MSQCLNRPGFTTDSDLPALDWLRVETIYGEKLKTNVSDFDQDFSRQGEGSVVHWN